MNKYIKTYNVILDNMDLMRYKLRPVSAIMYLQDAFARYTATKKMAAYDLFPLNQYWVVAGFNIDFSENLPFWSEEIKVEIWISEVSKLKIFTDFKLYRKDNVFLKGDALWFIIDKETKRPVNTNIVADRFEVCDEFVLGEHKKFNLLPKMEKINEIKHINNLSDIDFNNHVNNKSYINIAEMTLSKDFREKHILKSIKIKFNKETFLGDVLMCHAYKTDILNTYINTIEKDGVSVCDILTSWEEKSDKENIADYNLDVKQEKF